MVTTVPTIFILVDEHGRVTRCITTDRLRMGWAFIGYLDPKTHTIQVSGLDIGYKPEPNLDFESMVRVLADDLVGRN